MNIVAALTSSSPEKVVFDGPAGRQTFGEFDRYVAGLRAAVAAHVGPDDVVAVAGESTPAVLGATIGALGAGAVVLPINPRTPEAELAPILARAQAKLLIDCDEGDAGGWTTPTQLLAAGHAATAVVDRHGSDRAVLMATSGTSSEPRLAILTHANLAASVDQTIASAELLQVDDHVIVGVMPLSHVLGLVSVAFVALRQGATLLLGVEPTVEAVVGAVERHRATVLVAPPVFWVRFAAVAPARSAVASVRLALSGAAPLSGAVAQAVEQSTGLRIRQGYGLTEAASALTSAVGTDAPATSVGRPVPGVEMRLVDEFGDDALIGDVGEIWARGKNVFPGYLGDPEATAEVLDADGWLRTGDLAVVNEQAQIFIVGRNKDLIIVSGFNVAPREVEAVLASHPAVREAAVVGEPDREHGQTVVGYVVPDGDASPDDLIEHCRAQLIAYKVPSRIQLLDELPRGTTGKLQRRRLR